MKKLLLFIVLGGSLGAMAAELTWPEVPVVDRYQPIWGRSPFTVSSVAATEAPGGSWVLVGLSVAGNDSIVFLQNKETQERITVTREPNPKGFAIESVDQQAEILKSSAHIKTPTETITARFDAALMAVNNPAVQTPPPVPTNPLQLPPVPRPSSGGGVVRPIKRIVIPAPPKK